MYFYLFSFARKSSQLSFTFTHPFTLALHFELGWSIEKEIYLGCTETHQIVELIYTAVKV